MLKPVNSGSSGKSISLEQVPTFKPLNILMDDVRYLFSWAGCWRVAVVAAALSAIPLGHAQTLWTGPDFKFIQTSSARSDTIVAGKVVLTRGNRDVLYNTAAGERSAGGDSPADTEWALGALNDFGTLSFQSLESM